MCPYSGGDGHRRVWEGRRFKGRTDQRLPWRREDWRVRETKRGWEVWARSEERCREERGEGSGEERDPP